MPKHLRILLALSASFSLFRGVATLDDAEISAFLSKVEILMPASLK